MERQIVSTNAIKTGMQYITTCLEGNIAFFKYDDIIKSGATLIARFKLKHQKKHPLKDAYDCKIHWEMNYS